MATEIPLTRTQRERARDRESTCRRQAVRARFSSSIRRIHPPSSTTSSSRSLLRYVPSVAPLRAPLCLSVHPCGFTSERIGPESRAGLVSPLDGRTYSDQSVSAASSSAQPRLSSSSPPLPLMFLRSCDPARHHITSLLPLPRALLPLVTVTAEFPAAAPAPV